MATENRSIPYNEERRVVRTWLSNTEDGQFALGLAQRDTHASRVFPGRADAGDILTNDKQTDFAGFLEDHQFDLPVAKDSYEAVQRFQIDQKIERGWVRFFQCPFWLFLRRIVETGEPDYWNDPTNVLREAMSFPEFCTVPQSWIRGDLERRLGKAQGRMLFDATGRALELHAPAEAAPQLPAAGLGPAGEMAQVGGAEGGGI